MSLISKMFSDKVPCSLKLSKLNKMKVIYFFFDRAAESVLNCKNKCILTCLIYLTHHTYKIPAESLKFRQMLRQKTLAPRLY